MHQALDVASCGQLVARILFSLVLLLKSAGIEQAMKGFRGE